MEKTLAIVGAGRVGRALGRRLRELGWKIGVVVTRSEASSRRAVRFIGAGKPHAGLTRNVLVSNVVLIATPDDAISGVADELARMGGEELRRKIVLHTSGGQDSRSLAPLKEFGAAIGSLHPLQTFSGVGVPDLAGKVFAVEGDVVAVRAARQIARALGGSPVQIGAGKKVLYHAAAALSAGHVLALVEAATQLLISLGMKRTEATRALLPLTRQVLDNFERVGPRAAWTGPLARGDYKIVASHLRALQDSQEEVALAYEALNHLAARILAQDAAGTMAELEKISAALKPKAKARGGHG
ncbi:MAG TPA: DUF2520 domain-containing protein [Candidatus Acidoferrum sp.]|nr:DUF2520 domain-containing protein [Candidatus Acidoferrum sp.]